MHSRTADRPAKQLQPVGLAVERGQVVCPRRGLVDVELCFTCRDFEGTHEGEIESLLCSADGDPDVLLAPFVMSTR